VKLSTPKLLFALWGIVFVLFLAAVIAGNR
jgi:hypothetical protein